MAVADDIRDHLGAAAEALAGLAPDQQRPWLLHLLQLLDEGASGSDEYAAMLSRLTTDIRQRITLGQW
jgi:hypothetical protein